MDEIMVTSLKEYLDCILEHQNQNDGWGVTLFFRGQANSKWGVSPGLYRDNMIERESEMIQTAFQRAPHLFKRNDTPFEKLTTLQHYGLSTRLLDLTLNPLVALYFACQPHDSITTKIENDKNDSDLFPEEYNAILKKSDGVVYLSHNGRINFNSHIVNLILSLSRKIDYSNLSNPHISAETAFNISNELDISFLEHLKSEEEKYENLLHILRIDYFVIPSLNNERVAMQNGAFLLPGFDIELNRNDLSKSSISTKIKDFKHMFPWSFVIPSKYKKRILSELDFLNVNESTVFPELSSHLNYIKSKNHYEKNTILDFYLFYSTPLKDFYSWAMSAHSYTNLSKKEKTFMYDFGFLSPEDAGRQFIESIEQIIKPYLANLSDFRFIQKISSIILKESEKENWFNDEATLNQLNITIQNELSNCGYSEFVIRQKSNQIIRKLIFEYSRLRSKNKNE